MVYSFYEKNRIHSRFASLIIEHRYHHIILHTRNSVIFNHRLRYNFYLVNIYEKFSLMEFEVLSDDGPAYKENVKLLRMLVARTTILEESKLFFFFGILSFASVFSQYYNNYYGT